MRFLPAGDDAFLIELRDLAETLAMLDAIQAAPLAGVREVVPAARTLLIRFDPEATDRRALSAALAGLDLSGRRAQRGEVFDIPVVYDGEDLGDVADILGCAVKDLVTRHTEATYTVAFTGFAPGFAYMTCDDPTFDVPRRKSPRVRVPAGSVALGGKFCGIYPSESPGGWRLLGRTPVKVWDAGRARAAMLAPGDRVRFQRADKTVIVAKPAQRKPAVKRATEGLLVTRADRPALFQDLGRPGYADQGVGESGALDRTGLIEANLCVGNARNAAALEVTFGGFGLKADRNITLAVTGAPCPLAVQSANGRRHWAPLARPFELEAGDELMLEAPSAGMRSYLALRGGFDVARLLGSASTDTLAKVGPAPVMRGDLLAPANLPAGDLNAAAPRHRHIPKPGDTVTLDVVLGPRTDWFAEESLALLFAQEWKVTAEANRVGIRLAGARALEKCGTAELPSEATALGSIQVPHSGQPVLFLADHPLTGGYPVIGVVARHHLDLCGQLPGGAKIRFKPAAAFTPFVI
ncbi:MAG: 5-oxoprolinase/urea amidolyase family protein [Rhodospirillaceae bacterium]